MWEKPSSACGWSGGFSRGSQGLFSPHLTIDSSQNEWNNLDPEPQIKESPVIVMPVIAVYEMVTHSLFAMKTEFDVLGLISFSKGWCLFSSFNRIHHQKSTKTFATSSKAGVLLPLHWSPMGKQLVMRVHLDTVSGIMKAEFDAVENNFRRTMAQSQIVKIERVQNKFAWEHFTL